ncbi:MAG: PKD domain-containing protein [Saprospiraceae bacterium]|nr:PKD domain-containing protein [Saprospiraceae bacterium]
MKRLLFLLLLSLPIFLNAQTNIQISANITVDTKWTADNIYELTGASFIYVTNNATLTIDAGTLIKGNPAALVITRGSKLIAIGTAEQPIVFTSSKPAGQRTTGDWGGVLLLGKATVNCPGGECTVEGGLDATLGKYGGTDDSDNSGILKYVRIEFAGIAFQPNNETNGLTLGGVGSQTEISYVQVSRGGDDAFEWFGGTVNGKYLVANKTVDDMFDTDFGYRGTNQFLLGISDPNVADISGSNGFEADNDAQGSMNVPFSQALFTNATIIGPKLDSATVINSNYRRGFHLRRSTKQSIRNSIISGFPSAARLESGNSENYFLNSKELKIRNNIFGGYTKFMDSTSVNSAIIGDSLLIRNRVFANLSGVGLIAPSANIPNALPAANSPALTGANFDSISSAAVKTTYVGAFGSTDWSKCWCEWDPENADYSKGIDYVAAFTDFNFVVDKNTVQFTAPSISGATYSWDFGDFTTSNLQITNHSYSALGDFKVVLTVTTNRGCVKSINKTVKITEGAKEIAVNADIITDTKWTSNNIYNLTGVAFIYVKNNATLTIEAGTIIKGSPAALVITRGSKLIAIGEIDKPIVFTSAKPAGTRGPGDWGGVLILGKGKVNCPGGECTVEGGLDPILGKYGGIDDLDNSGILKYVRIEYAGIAFQPNNETNGLTLGGVGSQTTIENVQISFGGDDSFEWFGGTVNGKYLVAYKTIDDMFDTDFGYRGNNQFLLGVSDPNLADISGSNGFEADNDAQGSTNLPISQSIFSNATIIGPRKDATSVFNANFRRALHLRRSTKQSIRNSVIAGFPTGVRLESTNSENYYLTSKELNLSNNIFSNNGKLFDSTSINTKAISDQFITENRIYSNINELLLTDPYGVQPDAIPGANSPALTGAEFNNLNPYFERTTYVGAFGTNNWTKCWCEWDPNSADYNFSPIQYFKETVDFTSNFINNQTTFIPNLTGNYKYSWDFGDNTASDNSISPIHQYTVSGKYLVTLEITNSRGCVSKVTKEINVIITATSQLENISDIELYPNPNSGAFNLMIVAKKNFLATIELISAFGTSLYSNNVDLETGKNTIRFQNLNQIAKGYYTVRIITKEGTDTKLVLVM